MKSSAEKYIVYKVGNETYASPLLSIREVIEYQKPKHMPNMVSYFTGVINVRGVIVGVVDLREKFSCANEIQARTAMLLCDTDRGPLASVVDAVQSVIELNDENFDRNPPVKSKVDQGYLMGVAKTPMGLVTVVDIFKLVKEEQLKAA